MDSSATVEPVAKKRVSPLTIVGLALLVIGLACLGWVAYQYFGTNVVAEHAYANEKDSLRAGWAQDKTDSAQPDPQGKKKMHKQKAVVVPGDAIALLRIPAFGRNYEVPILSGTDMETLSHGVGHYSSTALPGEIGNFAVAGHRVTHGQPFSRLLDLKRGDPVVVETRDAIFTYVIDEPPKDLTVKASAGWVLDPVPGKGSAPPTKALLTLTTCQDLFHSSDRSIGFAHLASTLNKG